MKTQYFAGKVKGKYLKGDFSPFCYPLTTQLLVEEELDGRDDIVNLEDLLRLVLINEECGDLKVVANGRQLTANINQMKKPDILQAHSVINAIGDSISSISIWNIENQLGKYDFSIVNNLKGRQLFPDQIKRNHFDLILARHYWNCSITENLRCLNSVVNEMI